MLCVELSGYLGDMGTVKKSENGRRAQHLPCSCFPCSLRGASSPCTSLSSTPTEHTPGHYFITSSDWPGVGAQV